MQAQAAAGWAAGAEWGPAARLHPGEGPSGRSRSGCRRGAAPSPPPPCSSTACSAEPPPPRCWSNSSNPLPIQRLVGKHRCMVRGMPALGVAKEGRHGQVHVWASKRLIAVRIDGFKKHHLGGLNILMCRLRDRVTISTQCVGRHSGQNSLRQLWQLNTHNFTSMLVSLSHSIALSHTKLATTPSFQRNVI